MAGLIRMWMARPVRSAGEDLPHVYAADQELTAQSADRYLAPLAALALVASFLLSHSQAENGPVVCPFRLATGLPCPGCGLTRSFVATAHGRIGEAFAFNLFGPLLFAGFIAYAAAGFVAMLRGREFRLVDRLSLRHPAVAITVAVWLTWAVARMALTA